MSTKKSVGICIVGCGGYAHAHAEAFGSLPGVDLYFSSRYPKRAAQYAKRYRARAAGTYEDALANPGIRGVILSSPHDLHLPQAEAACRAGKAVLVEKPLARSVAEAKRMRRAAERAGVPLMLGENYAYLPILASLLIQLRKKRLGTVRLVEMVYHRRIRPTPWRLNKRKMGGGALIDMGVHMLRLLQTAFGPVRRLRTVRFERPMKEMQGESRIEVLMEHGGKTQARSRIDLCWAEPEHPGIQRLVVHGEKGAAVADFVSNTLQILSGSRIHKIRVPSKDPRGQRAMAKAFVGWIARGRPAIGITEALEDLNAVESAYRSARRGGAWERVPA